MKIESKAGKRTSMERSGLYLRFAALIAMCWHERRNVRPQLSDESPHP